MFDLEQSIAHWRQQMLAAGLKDSSALDELESHLRDDIEQQTRAGWPATSAFTLAVRRIGRASALQTEFTLAGETILELFQRHLLALAGIRKPQLATGMNLPNSNLEPRWATYLKTIAYSLPGLFLWVASCVFVVPRLKQICAASNTVIPRPLQTALAMSEAFKNYFIVLSVVFIGALLLLEWRSHWWPRHRRMYFGIAAFALNFVALILITAMLILAVLAGSNLLSHAK